MKILLPLVGLLALVALVSPCCVPNALQFNWTLAARSRNLHSDGLPYFIVTLSGRAAYVVSDQLFYTSLESTTGRGITEMFLNLSRQNHGFVVETRKYANRATCLRRNVYGQIRKPWRCYLDKMKQISGKPHYKIDIPGVMEGVVYMRPNSCTPTGARIVIDTNTGNGPDKLTAQLSFTNVSERIDTTVFSPPCTVRPGYRVLPFTIPTPDEVYQMIRRDQ